MSIGPPDFRKVGACDAWERWRGLSRSAASGHVCHPTLSPPSTLHMLYLLLELSLASAATLARALLGVELESLFDWTYLASSLRRRRRLFPIEVEAGL